MLPLPFSLRVLPVAFMVALSPWTSGGCAPRRPVLSEEELSRLARGEAVSPTAYGGESTSPGQASAGEGTKPKYAPLTKVEIVEGEWRINGKVTCPGSRAEGLLPNVRMVHATFDDRNPETRPQGFDALKNVEDFVAKIPEYAAQGVRAFTLNLQGGDPGYEGALNSAFEADGSLREEDLRRVARAIEACDRQGLVVILGCFHHRQDQVLRDAAAVKKAVAGTASWIRDCGYTNVVLEVVDEHPDDGYDHPLMRTPNGVKELIRVVRQTKPDLLVSASGGGGGRLAHQISVDADFLLLHFHQVPVSEVLERVASADKVSKAIVCNADGKTGEEGAQALEAAFNAFCSWGYSNVPQNEHVPLKFEGAADDPAVYAKLKELTTP